MNGFANSDNRPTSIGRRWQQVPGNYLAASSISIPHPEAGHGRRVRANRVAPTLVPTRSTLLQKNGPKRAAFVEASWGFNVNDNDTLRIVQIDPVEMRTAGGLRAEIWAFTPNEPEALQEQSCFHVGLKKCDGLTPESARGTTKNPISCATRLSLPIC
jgi:hypothetical protein